MRWRGRARSTNVEDRRGGRGVAVAGGGIGLLVILVVSALLGVDPTDILQGGGGGAPSEGPALNETPQEAEQREFVEVVLGDIESTWGRIFAESGADYPEPTLVLFSGAVRSACGTATSAVGPFYCPADHEVYLDLGFFQALADRLGAPGDFARAYVIAHEVGHHVQTVAGLVPQGAGGSGSQGADGASVRTELQADCLAGVWGHFASQEQGFLEPGDVEEALNAASAIGDDTLQRESQGAVVPDSFTHGTSAQRVRWFRRGFDQGTVGACDTFGAKAL